MRCDRCGREATIEEVTKVGQTYVYKHLCESCAANEGLGLSGQQDTATAPTTGPTTKTVISIKAKAARQAGQCCESCGLSFQQFRESGRVGCAACYAAFVDRLGPMIERAQEGGTHHVGKAPRRLLASVSGEGRERREAIERALGATEARQIKLDQLKRQLEAALKGERFEQAAIIRDEMQRLLESVTTGDAGEGAGDGDH